jgi:acyl carrier protein
MSIYFLSRQERNVSNKIRKFIIAQLEKKAPIPEESDIDNYRFLDTGHIDSMGLIKFILEIENEFDIALETEDTQSDEFRYISGLVRIIEDKLK